MKKKGLEKKTDKPKPKKDLLLSAEDLATSLNSVLGELPKVNKVGEVLDFDNANLIYQNFFADCQDEFVFKTNGQPKKFSVDVTRCKPAPAHWTIRAYEKRGMEEMKNYLVNMPDRTQKQTLCLMPDTKARPQQEEDLRGCTFHIINGQHSVAASKSLIEDNASEELVRDLRRWDAYIVWTLDIDKLRKISAFYNRVNHLAPFKPTWASNILASRKVWVKYGQSRLFPSPLMLSPPWSMVFGHPRGSLTPSKTSFRKMELCARSSQRMITLLVTNEITQDRRSVLRETFLQGTS